MVTLFFHTGTFFSDLALDSLILHLTPHSLTPKFASDKMTTLQLYLVDLAL